MLTPTTFHRLTPTDIKLYRSLMQLFGEVFEDPQSYSDYPPPDSYVTQFLTNDSNFVLAACDAVGNVIGGLVAYELPKFEQARTEIYIYDLAVAEAHQRQGIGTGLVSLLRTLANERGTHTIFVQADTADEGAVAFYRKLCSQEIDGVVFDIEPEN